MKKVLLFIMAGFLAGCGGTSYQDVSDNTLSISFSATDQKMLVDNLSAKLTGDTALAKELGNNKPTILIDIIKNKTSEQIDTESMTDTLKMHIVKSRLFSVINRDKMNILQKEKSLGSSGLSDSQRATKIGKLWGAKYVLYGNFSSIVNYVKSEKQVYYKFTLIVQDIETGEEIWIDEADLNKISKKPLF